mmetsp:Transcript_12758/g.19267  ORF Transcript_12758/g.19267 Transcript_12758/m.19267 type:complete len:181 (+) Transcript_12758:137-679(+)|eukprot:CAMPEP_0196810824 /NCGR_PEP_ID=MMETSP1362-20130617/14430_1 /TAXON_ID=163516 /ORGANISM="Leptocylindrus danicus, Strain CCMP1856" /LENGTH=180 /DNA_ID=CAMNT_0042185979 /DNA_START=109 /DNA_END=651 /DNA_ORIENTATION=+
MAPSAAIIEQESANTVMMDHRPTEVSVSTSAVKLPRDEMLDVAVIKRNNASVTSPATTAKRSYPAVDMNFYAHELVPVGLGAAAVFATTTAVVIVEDDDEDAAAGGRASKRVKGCNNGTPLSCPKLWRPVECSSGAPGMAVMTSLSHFQHAPKQQQPQPRVPCSDYSSEDSDSSDEGNEE